MFRKSACIAGLVVAGFMTADAQDARFEAVSIKPSADTSARSAVGATPGGGGLAMVNGTVAELIQYAFPVPGRDVSGGPAWVRTDRYDVQARAAGVTTRAQREAMLRTLLAKRFALRVRYETVERPVYRLVVMRADERLGPGLTQTTLDCEAVRTARARGELPPPPPTLEEQLGLKLEPARGPVQIVVIDRIERPTPD